METPTLADRQHSLFFLLAFLHLAALVTGEKFHVLQVVTKPLLVLSLLILFYNETAGVGGVFRKRILMALFFSWAGDVLLMFQEQRSQFFLFGLIAFLAAHIFYILAFINHVSLKGPSLLRAKPWLAGPFVLYGLAFFFLIRNGLGNLEIPVAIYMAVILVMALTALNRYGRVESTAFWPVFAGALCFITSDSLLAFNRFYRPFPFSGFLIMLTYLAAQYLIKQGCVKFLLPAGKPQTDAA